MYGAQSGIYLIIILAVIVLRMLRMRGVRPINPLMLVLMSALVLYITVQLVAFGGAAAMGTAAGAGAARGAAPAPGVDPAAIPFYVLGALLGLALGVVRGRTIAVFRDAATGKVVQKGGMLSLLIWLGLFALRFGIHYLVAAGLAGAWATALSDILLLVGTCSILGRNAYLLLRYAQLSAGPSAVRSG